MKVARSRCFRCGLIALAAAVLVVACAESTDGAPASRPVEQRVITVSEQLAALLPALAPVAARLGGDNPALMLVAIAADTEERMRFLDLTRARWVLELSAFGEEDPREERRAASRVTASPFELTPATLGLAEYAWGRSEEVVVAAAEERGAVLLGAALAARRRVPLILEHGESRDPIPAALKRLKGKKVIRVVQRRSRASWQGGPWTVETLDERGAAARLVALLGRDRIKTLILANPTDWQSPAPPAPDGRPDPRIKMRGLGGEGFLPNRAPWCAEDGRPEAPPFSMLAPYQGLLRGAPLVLCRSNDGLAAERAVRAFIRTHRLRPRSLTILAGHGSVGLVRMKDARRPGEYEVDIEPCSAPAPGGAAWLAVGRLGFTSLPRTSLMIARTTVRERDLQRSPFRATMIANPPTDYGPLPLAETISRATAVEFKNRRLRIDEFYGVQTDQPAVREAAEKANFILYEGHITDQRLFETPQTWPDNPLVDDRQDDTDKTNPWDGERREDPTRPKSGTPFRMVSPEEPWDEMPGAPRGPPEGEPEPPPPPPLRCTGMPLVILQSCHSLEEHTADTIFRAGAADFIGSVTGVHSASGSAFVKTFCDRLLYHDATVGEALRDARTYFLALARLKTLRGHKEHAKVTRVALTFRLWGDPEARVVPPPTEQPVFRPIRVKFVSPDFLDVKTPQRLLPDIKTEKYAVRAFPGAQLGGIVRRIKDRAYRRLMPLYFVDVEAPTEFFRSGYAHVLREGEEPNRATFITRHPHGREVYVIYLPEKAKTRGSHLFRFVRSRYLSQPALSGREAGP